MKKNLLFIAAIALLTAACADHDAFVLIGETTDAGLNGKTVYLQKINAERNALEPIDSTVVADGKFTFKGIANKLPDLRFVTFRGEQQPAHIFILERGKISLSIDSVTTVSGTPLNEQYQILEAEKNTLNDKMKALQEEYGKLVIAGELTQEAQARIDSVYEKNVRDMATLFFNFAKDNMSNPVGEFIFESVAASMDYSQMSELLALARPEFKKTEHIQRLEKQLTALNLTAIGQHFVDLKAKAPDGSGIALSDYAGKGNVVLLDFWASWCGPCRQEMPSVVAAYKKYKSKGFEIVGVSLDQDSAAWVNAIETLGITWPQLSDLKAWDSALSAAYGVNAIPHTVLIDGDGIIIAKDLHGKALSEKLEELLK
ncbi:MAG: AhpC/TSA family protein [Prevotella sp.]|jgi:peroxiredoxin|nr:AhpC/TSA family protein [Prevotella sp.]